MQTKLILITVMCKEIIHDGNICSTAFILIFLKTLHYSTFHILKQWKYNTTIKVENQLGKK